MLIIDVQLLYLVCGVLGSVIVYHKELVSSKE